MWCRRTRASGPEGSDNELDGRSEGDDPVDCERASPERSVGPVGPFELDGDSCRSAFPSASATRSRLPAPVGEGLEDGIDEGEDIGIPQVLEELLCARVAIPVGWLGALSCTAARTVGGESRAMNVPSWWKERLCRLPLDL